MDADGGGQLLDLFRCEDAGILDEGMALRRHHRPQTRDPHPFDDRFHDIMSLHVDRLPTV
jgi:hypothetical protein